MLPTPYTEGKQGTEETPKRIRMCNVKRARINIMGEE
jgi:hypothetical protein